MSILCHTDGYGIYLESDAGMELIGVRKDEERIAYALQPGTVRISRDAFANMRNLEVLKLPSSLEEIEEGAFSHGNRNVHFMLENNPYFTDQDGCLYDVRRRKLIVYTLDAEEIHLPEGCRIIGREAFRGCTSEALYIGDEIQEIHEEALTTCLLDRAVFTSWHARVYFPHRDIRMRQHMLEGFGHHGIFDFDRYDQDLMAGFIEHERMKEIAARLKWPYHLSREAEERFRVLLDHEYLNAVLASGEAGDLQTIGWYCDTGIINQDNVDGCLEALHTLPDLEPYAVLSEYRNTRWKGDSFDFSI
jgi:hypothetical protein